MTKFNIGDKVVPVSKSVWGSLEDSNVWRRAQEKNQDFLYINHYESVSEGIVTCCEESSTHVSGDFFKESDLVLYTEAMENAGYALAQISKLENLIDEANIAIEALKTHLIQESKNKVEVETETETSLKINDTRQNIINEAKEFVEKYRSVIQGEESNIIGNNTSLMHYYDTEFSLKDSKVTAIVYRLNHGKTKQNKPSEIGRAKCAPDDTFNRHIGEAIALGRALDINVDKFINAVQPTSFVVGQVVKGNDISGYYSKEKTFTLVEESFNRGTFYYKENDTDFIFSNQIGLIVDDTDAVYEV